MNELIGVVKLFAGNFAPKSWAFCQGQLLPIAQNQALFSILGTTYGGDGMTTFALPDLRNRVPVGNSYANGINGNIIGLGEVGGEQSHTLVINEIPSHTHMQSVSSADATLSVPTAGSSIGTPTAPSGRGTTQTLGFNVAAPDIVLNQATIGVSGSSQPHSNQQPYLGLNYIICLYGTYPSRN